MDTSCGNGGVCLFSSIFPAFTHCFPPLLFLVGAFNFPAFFIWRIIFFCNRTLENILPTQTLFSRFFPNFVPGCSTHFPSHVPIMFPSFPIDFPMDFPEFQHVFWHISASSPHHVPLRAFGEMGGTPSNHPFSRILHEINHSKPFSYWGYPHFRKPHCHQL